MSRRRNFVFTLYGYAEQTIQDLLALATPPTQTQQALCRFIAFQQEVCPRTQRDHLQGYIELYNAMSMRALSRIIPGRPHLEHRRGTSLQAYNYTQKDRTRKPGTSSYEAGTRARVNAQHVNAVAAIVGGASLVSVAHSHPTEFVRSYRGLNALRDHLVTKRDWPMDVHIYYGPTGTGKTYMANHEFPDTYTVPWPEKGGWWWPGYDGQHTVILDEFAHQITRTRLMVLMDQYACTVQYKGGNRQFTSKVLVITTNLDPLTEWFPKIKRNAPELLEPLYRRFRDFAKIYRFDAPMPRNRETGLPEPRRTQIMLGIPGLNEDDSDEEESDNAPGSSAPASAPPLRINVPFYVSSDEEDDDEGYESETF